MPSSLIIAAAMQAASPPVTVPPVLRSGRITNADYPNAALRADAEGSTRVRIEVGADGLVTGCSVVSSSGNAALDNTTCMLARRRFRYRPATLAGQPTAGVASYNVNWRMIREPAVQVALGRFERTVVVTRGAIEDCTSARSGIAFAAGPVAGCDGGAALIDQTRLGAGQRVRARQVVTMVPAGETDALTRSAHAPSWEQMADVDFSEGGLVTNCRPVSERGAYPAFPYLRPLSVCDGLDFATPFPEAAGRALHGARIQSVVYIEIDP